MARYLVVRAWIVEADTSTQAIYRARPGEHQDVRSTLILPSVPAVRLTFTTSGVHDLGETAEDLMREYPEETAEELRELGYRVDPPTLP